MKYFPWIETYVPPNFPPVISERHDTTGLIPMSFADDLSIKPPIVMCKSAIFPF